MGFSFAGSQRRLLMAWSSLKGRERFLDWTFLIVWRFWLKVEYERFPTRIFSRELNNLTAQQTLMTISVAQSDDKFKVNIVLPRIQKGWPTLQTIGQARSLLELHKHCTKLTNFLATIRCLHRLHFNVFCFLLSCLRGHNKRKKAPHTCQGSGT